LYKSVAIDKKAGLVDLSARWVSREVSNPIGYYSDTLHPSRIGYTDIADAVFRAINSI
jgi:hypothetical protein